MFLSIAIGCLSSPLFCQTYISYTNDILAICVTDFARLYNEEIIAYNVHGLFILANDVIFGPLYHFSAFVFESFLGGNKTVSEEAKFSIATSD